MGSYEQVQDTTLHNNNEVTEVLGKRNSSSSLEEMKMTRPAFKGTLEDLVMITNFKRFKRKGSTSRFKGVFYVKKEKKYRAQICLKGRKKYVGTFKTDTDAAIARDKRIREMYGEVEELLNFPNSKGQGAPLSLEPEKPAGFRMVGTSPVVPATGRSMNQGLLAVKGEVARDANQKMVDRMNRISGAAQSVQFDIPKIDKRFSNLTRYGSSSCSSASLTIPYMNLGANGSFPSTEFDLRGEQQSYKDSHLKQQVGSGLSQTPNQLIELGTSNIIANPFKYNQMGPYGLTDHTQATATQQFIQGSYPGYNNLVNLNFQDFSIPRQRAMLAKRFSSSETCGTNVSFHYNNEPLLQLPPQTGIKDGHHQPANGVKHLSSDGFLPVQNVAPKAADNAEIHILEAIKATAGGPVGKR